MRENIALRTQVIKTSQVTNLASITAYRLYDWVDAHQAADLDDPAIQQELEALLGVTPGQPGPIIHWNLRQVGAWTPALDDTPHSPPIEVTFSFI